MSEAVLPTPGDHVRVIKDLYRYVWKISGRDQVILSVLSVTLFLLELAPLELQRRIVNSAVDRQAFEVIGLLCLLAIPATLLLANLIAAGPGWTAARVPAATVLRSE